MAAILGLSNKRKSPLLSERASLYPEPLERRGMGALNQGLSICRNYITRQRLKQEYSAPSLFRTQ